MRLNVNGQAHDVNVDPDMPLLWGLRDVLGLTGTKFGCGMAQCGACMVHIDGEPALSCVTPMSAVGDCKITTIEGLTGPVAKAVQEAWTRLDVPQCGYCQSGQVMAAVALLTRTKKPTETEINEAMNGNLCRCATYHRIRASVQAAAETL